MINHNSNDYNCIQCYREKIMTVILAKVQNHEFEDNLLSWKDHVSKNRGEKRQKMSLKKVSPCFLA